MKNINIAQPGRYFGAETNRSRVLSHLFYGVKTVFAEHSSNKGKNKVTKKNSWHGNILSTAKIYRDFSSQADPTREN